MKKFLLIFLAIVIALLIMLYACVQGYYTTKLTYERIQEESLGDAMYSWCYLAVVWIVCALLAYSAVLLIWVVIF